MTRRSRRKDRQAARTPPDLKARSALEGLELPDTVERVEHELQGKWNTFCVFVHLGADGSPRDVEALAPRFDACLENALGNCDPPLDWSVSFWKAGELVSSESDC